MEAVIHSFHMNKKRSSSLFFCLKTFCYSSISTMFCVIFVTAEKVQQDNIFFNPWTHILVKKLVCAVEKSG